MYNLEAEIDTLKGIIADQERAIAWLRESSERELRLLRESSDAVIRSLEDRLNA